MKTIPKPGKTRKNLNSVLSAREQRQAREGGETPLDYMLRVMRDSRASTGRRDRMAQFAAPYIHPKLATLQTNMNISGRLTLEALVAESMKSLPANDDGTPVIIEGEASEVDETAALKEAIRKGSQ